MTFNDRQFLKIKKQNARVNVLQKYQNFEKFLQYTTFYDIGLGSFFS